MVVPPVLTMWKKKRSEHGGSLSVETGRGGAPRIDLGCGTSSAGRLATCGSLLQSRSRKRTAAEA
eukprot:scaffold94143_cov31-Tisochrysis_lutea.AAC.1